MGSSDRVWNHIPTPQARPDSKTMWEMNNNRKGGEHPPILRIYKKVTTPLTGDQRKKRKKKKEKKNKKENEKKRKKKSKERKKKEKKEKRQI